MVRGYSLFCAGRACNPNLCRTISRKRLRNAQRSLSSAGCLCRCWLSARDGRLQQRDSALSPSRKPVACPAAPRTLRSRCRGGLWRLSSLLRFRCRKTLQGNRSPPQCCRLSGRKRQPQPTGSQDEEPLYGHKRPAQSFLNRRRENRPYLSLQTSA